MKHAVVNGELLEDEQRPLRPGWLRILISGSRGEMPPSDLAAHHFYGQWRRRVFENSEFSVEWVVGGDDFRAEDGLLPWIPAPWKCLPA